MKTKNLSSVRSTVRRKARQGGSSAPADEGGAASTWVRAKWLEHVSRDENRAPPFTDDGHVAPPHAYRRLCLADEPREQGVAALNAAG
jgi:hypothetical protein